MVRHRLKVLDKLASVSDRAVIYHGSPFKIEGGPTPQKHPLTGDKPVVFGTPNRGVALAFMGKRWTDADFDLGSVNRGPLTLTELRKGALRDTFKGQKGYLYTLDSKSFSSEPGLWSAERVSSSKPTVLKVERIDDVHAELVASGDIVVKTAPGNNLKKQGTTVKAHTRKLSKGRSIRVKAHTRKKKAVLEKLAVSSAVFKRISKLPKEQQRVAYRRLYRSQGVEPPLFLDDALDKGDMSVVKSHLRDINYFEPEPLIKRTSKVNINALRDLRAKRFRTLEAGVSVPGAQSLANAPGPSTPLSNRTSPRDNVRIDDDYDYRYFASQRKIEDSKKHPRTGRPLQDPHEGRRLAARRRLKASQGLYMAQEGTERSADYARRAAEYTGDPKGGVVAQLDFPESLMINTGRNNEYVIPRELIRKYGRNPRTTKRDPSQRPEYREFYPIPRQGLSKI